jgi:hypothetical protein
MQVTKFLEKIQNSPELPLLFEFGQGNVVQGGYHVTEIKNAGYETIDCGNSLHSWKEVVVQIWVPQEAKLDDEKMPTSKFTKIWDVVDSRLNLHRDAEIRIEYGDAAHLTSNYHVDDVVVTEDGLVVQMAPPRTMCKPREILIPLNGLISNTAESSCCTPTSADSAVSSRKETVSPLPIKIATVSSSSTCCAPAAESKSNCC